MQKHLFNLTLVLLAGLFFTLSSCKKDHDDSSKDDSDKIVGKWEIQSFKLDGVEIKGTIVASSTLEMEDELNFIGNFKWSIRYADGTSDNTTGNYVIDESKKEIHFESENGEELHFEYGLPGNHLELSGMKDGEQMDLKAVRN